VLAGGRAAIQSTSPTCVRFADFELDLRTGELRRNGLTLKLQPQPARVLAILVGQAGEMVTRQELAQQVWGQETFVDFEQGLNFAVRQIRTVLEDDVNHPRFLETLPKRGYRFIGLPREARVAESATIVSAPTVQSPAPPQAPNTSRRYGVIVGAMVLLGLAITFGASRLRRLQVAASDDSFRSVAVLPLRNLSSDPDQEYFSDGITDELITELAKVSGLHVISHTSVQRYKQSKLSLKEIAHELHADAVIEGTVMRSGDRVRITAQLIDASTDRHLWAEKYDRDFRDILNLQSDVAQQIASQVGVNLTVNERARLSRTPVVDPVAHEAYLKGHFYWDKLRCSGFKQALAYYQQAVAKDPTFAQAYAEVGDTYYNLGDWGCSPQTEAFAKSREATLKAIALDPGLAAAHAQLADLDFTADWNWPKAEKEYAQAIQLDPNDASSHSSYAIFLVAMGKPEQAITEMKKAHELDPVSEITNMLGTYIFYLAHRYDEAAEQGKKTLELYPNSGATWYWMGHIYEQKGMPAEAFNAYLKSNNASAEELAALHAAFEKEGLQGFWIRQFTTSENKPDWPCWKAMFYGHLGDKEHAIELLEESFQHHCDGMQFLKTNPVFDNLRDDPRYKSLVAQLKL
jgi:TolB-like protein/DNA-binding winged helix-turn-helix (wHTH) protein